MRIEIFNITIRNKTTGEKRQLFLPQINDLILIQRVDLIRYFNVSPSTIDTMVSDSKLKRYCANGMQKIGNGKTSTYYNLAEFLNAEMEQKQVNKPKTLKIKVVTIPHRYD